MTYIEKLGERAQKAKRELASASAVNKNKALRAVADALRDSDNLNRIIEANKLDVADAPANGISEVMTDRLRLDKKRVDDIADAVETLIKLDDPIGEIISGSINLSGLSIRKVRVPIGVIAIIYESRPNVTVDAATLCLKSGNAAILRGGKAAINTNVCLVNIMREAIEKAGLSADTVQLVEDTSRELSLELMKCSKYVDLLIPRGGAGLIRTVVENATVPVIETGVGNCHIFIDESADLDMAVRVAVNGKTQRPSVCNALETMLVSEKIADKFLPMLKPEFDRFNVEIRGCDRTAQILGADIVKATEDDYAREFLDYIIACKVVSGIDEAIEHISRYSTGHSECIITKSLENAERFQREIDSAAVYVNASTRFTDGGEFGLGAEIGISTQKMHARGPLGLRELTSMKFLINGNGQIR